MRYELIIVSALTGILSVVSAIAFIIWVSDNDRRSKIYDKAVIIVIAVLMSVLIAQQVYYSIR